MKFNEHGGFDGLNETIRTYTAADYGEDEAGGDGYEGNDLFDDDEGEEEEVVVTMALEDDGALDLLEDIADDLLEPGPHAEEAVLEAAPPSPVAGYTPAITASKPAQKSEASVAASVVEMAAKKAEIAKKAAEKAAAKKAAAEKAAAKKAAAEKAAAKKAAAKKAAVKKATAKKAAAKKAAAKKAAAKKKAS